MKLIAQWIIRESVGSIVREVYRLSNWDREAEVLVCKGRGVGVIYNSRKCYLSKFPSDIIFCDDMVNIFFAKTTGGSPSLTMPYDGE